MIEQRENYPSAVGSISASWATKYDETLLPRDRAEKSGMPSRVAVASILFRKISMMILKLEKAH